MLILPWKLNGGCIHGSWHIGHVILHGQRSRQHALGQVAEVEAGVDGQDLGGQQRVVDGTEALGGRVLQATVLPAEQEATADLGRGGDDGEEHAGQVEVPEVAGDLHAVVEESNDGDREVESTADVVALLDVRHLDGGDDEGVPAPGPQVGSWKVSTQTMHYGVLTAHSTLH